MSRETIKGKVFGGEILDHHSDVEMIQEASLECILELSVELEARGGDAQSHIQRLQERVRDLRRRKADDR